MFDDTMTYVHTYVRWGSNVQCVFKMEKRAHSGSAKRKQRKEKEAKDAALVQQIPSISTFFTRKVGQDYGAHSSGANTTGHRDDLQDANTASSSSPEMFSSGGAALPPTDTVADNACSTTAGSSRAAEPGQPELSPLTSPAEDEMLAAGNEPESAVPQRDDDEDSWCETVTDPALWGNISSDKVKSVLIERGPSSFQNRRAKYPASTRDCGLGGRVRSLTNDMMCSRLPNGQLAPREWVVYSPSTGHVFCFACKLFGVTKNAFVDGFCDWKHPHRISEHERSPVHMSNMLTLMQRMSGTGAIDSALRKQTSDAREYWRGVLRRVVAVIKFLGERGLAFRGNDELLGSPHNGNYLGILELISQFDPFLAEHIKTYGQKGRGSVSYLSSTICEEFIDMMGEKTRQLQKADIELMTAVRLLRSLREFVSAQRDLFTDFEKEALAVPGVCQTYKYDLQRTRKRKRFEDDSAEKDAVFDGKSKFQIETFSVAIDKLVSCLSHRIDAYKHLCDLFGVLFMPENTSDRELIDKANTLASAYPADLDSNLGNELIHFRSFIRSDGQNVPPSKCLKTILDCGLQSTFPNVYIAVRLYLTLPVTNCEGERSFSQMARIKNELRTKMTQRRFNSLSLMAIEAELVRELDFDDLIKDFSSKKARKKPVV
ncbi:hypothetical protein ABVT39_024568 [Epinephelus coioides]